MKHWLFIGVLVMVALGVFFALGSEPLSHGKEKRIGMLVASDIRMTKVEGLKAGLANYGYLEGENIHLIVKNAGNDLDLLPQYAKEFVNENVDVIVTTGTYETLAAKEATAKAQLPVVFVGLGCSVEMGIVKDSVNPGCNVTGVDSHYVELSGKRLEYLKRLKPSIQRVLVLYNPKSTPIGPSARYLYEAADKLAIQLKLVPTANSHEVKAALGENREQADAVLLMCSLLFEIMTDYLTEWSIAEKVPVMGVSEQQAEKGILASYGLPYMEEGRQAARIVGNVLRKQNPANIPVESPARLEFYLNVKSAKQLGIEVNPSELPFITKYIEGTAAKGK